jgi:hypothetical protein
VVRLVRGMVVGRSWCRYWYTCNVAGSGSNTAGFSFREVSAMLPEASGNARHARY